MIDLCVCCGAVIPEGRMVCWGCNEAAYSKHDSITIIKSAKYKDKRKPLLWKKN